MNYQKIYKSIVERAKSENRVSRKFDEYERHHIIPDFMFANRSRKGPKGHLPGNPNSAENIVCLTFKEHFICHLLLVKILKHSRYAMQAYTSVLLMLNPPSRGNKNTKWLAENRIVKTSLYYDAVKRQAKQAISAARTGVMYMFDSKTMEYVGQYPVNHPNFINGIWCHGTKGRCIPDEEREMRREMSSGDLNRNAKDVDYDYIKMKMIEFANTISKPYHDGLLIRSQFIDWFDHQEHPVFIQYRNISKLASQKLTGMSSKTTRLQSIAQQVSIITNTTVARYGAAKYVNVQPWRYND